MENVIIDNFSEKNICYRSISKIYIIVAQFLCENVVIENIFMENVIIDFVFNKTILSSITVSI